MTCHVWCKYCAGARTERTTLTGHLSSWVTARGPQICFDVIKLFPLLPIFLLSSPGCHLHHRPLKPSAREWMTCACDHPWRDIFFSQSSRYFAASTQSFIFLYQARLPQGWSKAGCLSSRWSPLVDTWHIIGISGARLCCCCWLH